LAQVELAKLETLQEVDQTVEIQFLEQSRQLVVELKPQLVDLEAAQVQREQLLAAVLLVRGFRVRLASKGLHLVIGLAAAAAARALLVAQLLPTTVPHLMHGVGLAAQDYSTRSLVRMFATQPAAPAAFITRMAKMVMVVSPEVTVAQVQLAAQQGFPQALAI
jgi:hypothetical protein